MMKFYMFYGTQAYEFERPELNVKPIKIETQAQTYNAKVKPSANTVKINPSKVVVKL